MLTKFIAVIFLILALHAHICKLQFLGLGRGRSATGGPSTEFKQDFKTIVSKCLTQHKADFVQTLALYTLKTGTKNSKCAVLCILQNFRMMDKDGNYNKEKYQMAIDKMQNPSFQAAFRKNLNECMREDISDPCERAFQFTDCLTRKSATLPKVPGNSF